MRIGIQLGTKGIEFVFDKKGPEILTPSNNANQTSPRKFYVYGHYDKNGIPFYIGKGKGRRAWDKHRHYLWHHYVTAHLNGEYEIKIIIDGLTSEEAEQIESEWVSQESHTLVNWVNYGRETDFQLIDEFHRLRNENREQIKIAKKLEKNEIEKAIKIYKASFFSIYNYAKIQPEKGLVGKLIDELKMKNGIHGDIQVLDRLTLCLLHQKKYSEIIEFTDIYFSKYRADLVFKAATRILARVQKAKEKVKIDL